jgi:hypothetical protein
LFSLNVRLIRHLKNSCQVPESAESPQQRPATIRKFYFVNPSVRRDGEEGTRVPRISEITSLLMSGVSRESSSAGLKEQF